MSQKWGTEPVIIEGTGTVEANLRPICESTYAVVSMILVIVVMYLSSVCPRNVGTNPWHRRYPGRKSGSLPRFPYPPSTLIEWCSEYKAVMDDEGIFRSLTGHSIQNTSLQRRRRQLTLEPGAKVDRSDKGRHHTPASRQPPTSRPAHQMHGGPRSAVANGFSTV